MATARQRLGFVAGTLIAVLAAVALAVGIPRAAAPAPTADPGPAKAGIPAASTDSDTVDEEAGGDEDVNAEAAEQREGVEQRIEAWQAAKKAGKEADLPEGRRAGRHDRLDRRGPGRPGGRRLGTGHRH
jgi:hypothetical protein